MSSSHCCVPTWPGANPPWLRPTTRTMPSSTFVRHSSRWPSSVKELKPAIDRVATATPSMDERFDGLHGWGDEPDRGVRGREWRRAAHGAGDSRVQGLRSDRRPPRCSRRPVLQIERSSADIVVREEVAGALSRLGQRFDELEQRLSEVSTRPDETVHQLAALRDELAAREERLDAVGRTHSGAGHANCGGHCRCRRTPGARNTRGPGGAGVAAAYAGAGVAAARYGRIRHH